MSSRVLKKLHGDNNLEIKEQDEQQSDVEIESETNDGTITKSKPININPYDLLNQQSLSESEFKEDDNETEHTSNATNPRPCEQAKKKKKKRKKKSVKQTQRRSSEDNADLDEITRTVREVNKLLNTGKPMDEGEPSSQQLTQQSTSSNQLPTPVIKSLLQIQHKNLNPSYEMKRMFGHKVVQNEQNKRRNNNRLPRPFKSTWLVTFKDIWPPMTKSGLSMSIETDKQLLARSKSSKDCMWFKFEHSPPYRALQMEFLVAVDSLDSENIIKILNLNPYHIDATIQLNELCKMGEDSAMGAELIEHAVYAYEIAFHPMFNIAATNCRIDYVYQENRGFYLVLFKHAQYLEGRACSRTALELSKLILSLDPENDPLAMTLIIDFYAIRSKQFEWLVQFYNEWESTKKLSQLPNWAYSYAIGLHHLHRGTEKLKLADDALQYALLMFPGVLILLLKALSVQYDAAVNSCKYFADAFNGHSASLQHLIILYVERSKLNWKDTDLLHWLQKNVTIAMATINEKNPILREYTLKRCQRYPKPPREILRHIVLSDLMEKIPLGIFLAEGVMSYDPLPPHNSIDIYHRPSPSTSSNSAMPYSPFSTFFQSLLPTFNVQDPARRTEVAVEAGMALLRLAEAERVVEPAIEGGAAAGQAEAAATGTAAASAAGTAAASAAGTAAAAGTSLPQALNDVVQAMRDFLTRTEETINDGDADNDNESSDD